MSTPFERIGLSRRSIDRAGDLLRDWYLSGSTPGEDVRTASVVVAAYRSTFEEPLADAEDVLRFVMSSGGHVGTIGKRLKREPRIVSKLARLPTMALTRMQDIAGCRAVVADLAAVEAVRSVAITGLAVSRTVDYNAKPRSSGYRAVHLIVSQDGVPIEVQLRTQVQHAWAMLVEDLDTVIGTNLKDESGPPGLLGPLRVYAAEVAEHERAGRTASAMRVLEDVRVELLRMARIDR